MKIRPVRTELLHVEVQADAQTHDEANGRFSQFCDGA